MIKINLRSHFTSFISALMLVALIGCSGTTKKTTKVAAQTPVTVESSPLETSAIEYIEQAKNQTNSKAFNTLVIANKQYLTEQQYTKSLWLAEQLLLLAETERELFTIELLKSESLYNLEMYNEAFNLLIKNKNIVNQQTQTNKLTYFQLLAIVANKQRRPIIASEAFLQAFQLNNAANEQDIEQIWRQLTSLSSWELTQLSLLNPPQYKGWESLLSYSQKNGHNPILLARNLTQWQRQFPSHPANSIVEELTKAPENMPEIHTNIAVLLPLSGKQTSAGLAAQQGILARFKTDESKEIRFFDTNNIDFTQITALFTTNNIDFVIGPLLKNNVDHYIENSGSALPTLLLNTPNKQLLQPNQTIFSMRREDEAIQAATTLSRQNFKSPMVLSLSDNISKRITKTFLEQWQHITSEQPEVIYFDNKANMQNSLKTSLDVELSQRRIKILSSKVRKNVEIEPRSRRDIDMIYLVGSPQNSRLLKPYIDVNISRFANKIPVYASSLSHSAHVDQSEITDLSGLTFTEMPWLLKDKQQNTLLAELSRTLWPQRSDSLERIFAMGYDSYALIDKISAMKASPYLRHFGQTGVLQLSQNNVLTRSLLWGQYSKAGVNSIVFQ